MKMIKGLLLAFMLISFVGCSEDEVASSSTLSITNAGSESIWYVYYALSTDSSWGEDRLGASTISSGDTKEFQVTDCDKVYDVKVQFYNGAERFASDQYMACGDTVSLTASNY